MYECLQAKKKHQTDLHPCVDPVDSFEMVEWKFTKSLTSKQPPLFCNHDSLTDENERVRIWRSLRSIGKVQVTCSFCLPHVTKYFGIKNINWHQSVDLFDIFGLIQALEFLANY